MARPRLYFTVEERRTARRESKAAERRLARGLSPLASPAAHTSPQIAPPVDAVVSLFDAASRRVTADVFNAQAQSASPAERQTLRRFATALRASFMGEAEVLIARCL